MKVFTIRILVGSNKSYTLNLNMRHISIPFLLSSFMSETMGNVVSPKGSFANNALVYFHFFIYSIPVW